MPNPTIPVVPLKLELSNNSRPYTESILVNEVKGIHVEYIAIDSDHPAIDFL